MFLPFFWASPVLMDFMVRSEWPQHRHQPRRGRSPQLFASACPRPNWHLTAGGLQRRTWFREGLGTLVAAKQFLLQLLGTASTNFSCRKCVRVFGVVNFGEAWNVHNRCRWRRKTHYRCVWLCTQTYTNTSWVLQNSHLKQQLIQLISRLTKV